MAPRKTSPAADEFAVAPTSLPGAVAEDLTFADAPLPTRSERQGPNPFRPVCRELAEAYLADGSQRAKAVRYTDPAQLARYRSLLATLGRELGVTFRTHDADGILRFWPNRRQSRRS